MSYVEQILHLLLFLQMNCRYMNVSASHSLLTMTCFTSHVQNYALHNIFVLFCGVGTHLSVCNIKVGHHKIIS